MLERVLEDSERVLGMEHPNTLIGLNNLALLLSNQGDYARARLLHERALEAQTRVLGKEHRQTLVTVNNLGLLLDRQGNYAGARRLYEQALEAQERVLGKDHPETLKTMENLAGLLFRRGDFAGAWPLTERALKGSERRLGREHPDTLTLVNGLAIMLDSQGDYAGARPLFERTLVGFINISREMQDPHPNLRTSVANYARVLERQGFSREKILSVLAEMGGRYGVDLKWAGGRREWLVFAVGCGVLILVFGMGWWFFGFPKGILWGLVFLIGYTWLHSLLRRRNL